MKYLAFAAALLLAFAAQAEPSRRSTAKKRSGAGQQAARGAAQALANLCKPTITCKVGDNPAFVIPKVNGPVSGLGGKLFCRYEVGRSGKKWVGTHKSDCSQVPVHSCKTILPIMRPVSSTVSYMNRTPQNGKCLVMPKVSLRQK